MDMQFWYARNELKANFNVVMAAVTNEGRVLSHVNHSLRDDKRIVLAAVGHQSPSAFGHASERLKRDLDVVLLGLQEEPHSLSCLTG